MAREDFATEPSRKGLTYPKNRNPRERSGYAPDPRIVAILDPRRMPPEIAKALEDPDRHEIMHAVVGDRHFDSGSDSLSDDLELRAQTRDEIADGPRWCAVCKTPFMFRGMDFFWNGMPVCDECPPENWRDIQRGGYAYARERVPGSDCWAGGHGDDEIWSCERDDKYEIVFRQELAVHRAERWEEAIVDYIEALGARG